MRNSPEFDQLQAQTAREFGYGADVAAMNADHDPLHRALCRWLGIESHAMRDAAGVALAPEERELAHLEEVATLAVQRFMRRAGAAVPAPG